MNNKIKLKLKNNNSAYEGFWIVESELLWILLNFKNAFLLTFMRLTVVGVLVG